ncbi:MAG: Ig-like domain-containing protein [Erythrobacter sp.]
MSSAAAFAVFASAAPAAAGPFTCSGEIYQVQSGQLRVFDPISSSYVDIGPQNGSYNATGFNTQDNFAYGMQGSNVIRIHSDGTIENVFNIGQSSFAGDVDDNNTYWLRGSSANRLVSVNLTTGARQDFVISGQVNSAADFMFVREGGVPYLLMVASGRVGIVNLNTMTSIRRNVAGLPGGGFGAQWTDFNGRIFAFRNSDGTIHELFDVFTNSPTASLAAQGDPSGNNDGFSCPNAPFPNLPPVARDDDFTTPFETALTRDILINNGNGADFDPEGDPVSVTPTPVVPPSNGSVTLNPNGSMTYTPNAGFYGTDTYEYQISDITGLTATAVVTIMVPAPPIDLVTRKSLASGTSNPIAGDTVTFLIEVTNNGPADATGVSLIDVLPAGLTATANNGNVTAGSYAPGTGVWTLGTIANGATESLTLEGTVDAGTAGMPITNVTTKAEGDQTDPTDSGNDLGESLVVFPLVLNANDDNSLDIVSNVGSTNALNVYDGDTLQNVPTSPSDTTVGLAPGETLPAGVTFDTATGIVGVTAGTAPGVYSFDYQICEIASPTNCDIATATVTVVATPIDAMNDQVFGIIGANGASAVLNAFAADTLDGAAATSGNTVLAVAPGSNVPSGLVFNTATGDVDVAPGTAAGNYTFDYQLCEAANTTNCDIANIFVEVIAAEILAVNDPQAPVLGITGNPNIGNAFDNDTLDGIAVDPSDLTTTVLGPASPQSPGDPVPVLDTATGVISVPANTPGGNYAIRYQICEIANPMNCDIAFVTVPVIATVDLSISKTNTPGLNGEVDQPSDTLTSGDTVTYTLVVTNNGPDSVEGAVVKDTPTAGLTCAPTNPVTITGDGVPTGSLTVGNLIGAGISLELLTIGQSTTLTFDCAVN